MSLIEIGETGSWLAHFFEKTVGSYAKKPAELYYLSFGFLFGCSVLLQTTPSQFHRTLINYCPSLPREGALSARLLSVTARLIQSRMSMCHVTAAVIRLSLQELSCTLYLSFQRQSLLQLNKKGCYLTSLQIHKPNECCRDCLKRLVQCVFPFNLIQLFCPHSSSPQSDTTQSISGKCIQRSFEKSEQYQKTLEGKYFFHTKECYHLDCLLILRQLKLTVQFITYFLLCSSWKGSPCFCCFCILLFCRERVEKQIVNTFSFTHPP